MFIEVYLREDKRNTHTEGIIPFSCVPLVYGVEGFILVENEFPW